MSDDDDLYFVIDTEQYAGNFERELTAYVTGHVGECGVGKKQAAQFFKELAIEDPDEVDAEDYWDDLIGTEGDEHACYRPCKIYPTPGWFNNGKGKHFRKDDPGYTPPKNGNQYPAYQSVAIVLNRQPTEDEIARLKERAHAWDGNTRVGGGYKPTITGFRLVTERTVAESTTV